MSQRRYPPDSPFEWLNRPRSDLALAGALIDGAYLEDLCFHAQQAAEKAIKAVLIDLGIAFPYTHDIEELMRVVGESQLEIPTRIRAAGSLTEFAIVTRYPGTSPPVTDDIYQEAIALAEQVVGWAESVIQERNG